MHSAHYIVHSAWYLRMWYIIHIQYIYDSMFLAYCGTWIKRFFHSCFWFEQKMRRILMRWRLPWCGIFKINEKWENGRPMSNTVYRHYNQNYWLGKALTSHACHFECMFLCCVVTPKRTERPCLYLIFFLAPLVLSNKKGKKENILM